MVVSAVWFGICHGNGIGMDMEVEMEMEMEKEMEHPRHLARSGSTTTVVLYSSRGRRDVGVVTFAKGESLPKHMISSPANSCQSSAKSESRTPSDWNHSSWLARCRSLRKWSSVHHVALLRPAPHRTQVKLDASSGATSMQPAACRARHKSTPVLGQGGRYTGRATKARAKS